MDIPVHPGDALAQPTRARLFALLGELGRPAATEELAKLLGLHPNGVRIHLERLLAAGLIERRRERIARGRPRDTWVISADAQPGGDPPTGYTALARWLVRSLATAGASSQDLEAVGRRIGCDFMADSGRAGGGEQALFDALASLGFQPEREPVGGDCLIYRLRNCPYREAVRERQQLVCALHRGMTVGMLERVSEGGELASFEAKDPDSGGCIICVRGVVVRQRSPAASPR